MAINKNKVMEVAQKFVEKGQLDKAIKEYLKIVDEDPRDVRVWLKLGDLYAKKNAKQEATDTYLRVAQFYGEQGFYLKAVAVYKQVLKLDPRLIEVNIRLAEVYRQLGLLSDAMQQYELVAAFYHREGKTREALATIRELVDLDPENVATRIKLAELYSKESMIKEAVAEFTKAADYLRANGRLDDFMKVAERLVWHQPDNHAMNRELAQLYLKRNDPRHALQKLQACFKADPRDVETLGLLAAAFLALDQKQKSISVWKELARIHGENNQPLLAADVYRKILAVSPDDGDALAALGGRHAHGSGNVPLLDPPLPPASAAARRATPLVSAPTAAVSYPSRPLAPAGSEPGAPRLPPVRSEPPPATSPVVTLRPPGTLRPSGPGATQQSRVPPPPPRGRSPEVSDGVTVEIDEEREATNRAGIGTGLPLTSGDASARSIELELGVGDVTRADESDHRGELIAKILSEADVYVKYGIREKAAQHLLRVFDIDPRNIDAHERLKDVYLSLGRKIDAAGVLARLVELSGGVNPGAADGYLRELSALSPGDPRVGELAMRYRIRKPALPMPAADDADDAHEAEIEIETMPPGSSPSIRQLDSTDMILEPEPSGSVETTTVGDEATQIGAPAATRGGEFIVEETDDGTVDVDGAEVALEVADPVAAESGDHELAFDEITGGTTTASDKTYDNILAARAIGDPAAAAAPVAVGEVEIDPEDEAAAEPPSGSGERPAAATSLEDDLDEADFFVSQNLFDEARAILGDLLARHPGHPLILAKMRDLDGGSGVRAPGRAGTQPGVGGGAAAAAPAARAETSAAITDDSGARRRPAVIARPLGGSDVGTHYDLGMAYKEMGLHEEAIKEFALVREAPAGRDRAVQCYLMIGLCQAERGRLGEAVDEFKAGLYVDHITEREAMALYFELGAAYQALGDVREALYYFEKVHKRDPRFRDVDRRITALKSGDDEGAGPRNGRTRSASNPAVEVDDSGDAVLRAIDSLGEPGRT
jgi:tetratricopeptide (TPR) repeat protein